MSLQQDILNLQRRVDSIQHKLCLCCGESPVVPVPFTLFTQNSPTIELSGTGTSINPLTAILLDTGGVDTLFAGQNSNSINWTAGGTNGHTPTVDVILSNDFNQDIEERVDGLYAPGFYIEATKAELDAYILAGTLEEGATYKITDADSPLYGGTPLYLKAVEGNRLSSDGIGLFYNPKYDLYPIWERFSTITITLQSGIFTLGETITANNGATATIYNDVAGFIIPLTGDWTTATSITGGTSAKTATVSGFTLNSGYIAGDKVTWGGKVWVNQTGNIGTFTDIYTLDVVNWTEVPYDTVDYSISYDEIKYDYENNKIIYRKDINNNIVSTSVVTTQLVDDWYSVTTDPIKAFQWGNIVVSGNKITDSYFEIINQKGNTVLNNVLDITSIVYNFYINGGSFSYNNLQKSSITTLSLYNSDFLTNIINNKSQSEGCCFSNVNFQHNVFSDNCFIKNNRIYDADVENNVFENGSSLEGNFRNCQVTANTVTNNSYIQNNAFTGANYDYGYSVSSINRNTITDRSSIYSNKQLLGTIGNVAKNNIHIDSSISSNILDYGGKIEINTLNKISGINSNNLALSNNCGTIYHNNLSIVSTISNNTGVAYILANELSSHSSINNNTVASDYGLEIESNILKDYSAISYNQSNYYAPGIKHSELIYGQISRLNFTTNAVIREIYVHNTWYNGLQSINTNLLVISTSCPLIYDCKLEANEYWLNIYRTMTGAVGLGAVGALDIPNYNVPKDFFIDEVWVDLLSYGVSFGVGAAINLGLETQAPTDALDNTTGDLATINGTITKIVKSSYTPASTVRNIIASVVGNTITAGTLHIKLKLKRLQRTI